jgi:hypothetical protein
VPAGARKKVYEKLEADATPTVPLEKGRELLSHAAHIIILVSVFAKAYAQSKSELVTPMNATDCCGATGIASSDPSG